MTQQRHTPPGTSGASSCNEWTISSQIVLLIRRSLLADNARSLAHLTSRPTITKIMDRRQETCLDSMNEQPSVPTSVASDLSDAEAGTLQWAQAPQVQFIQIASLWAHPDGRSNRSALSPGTETPLMKRILTHNGALIFKVIGIASFVFTAIALWPAVASFKEARKATLLAEWTSKKDFLDYCEEVSISHFESF